MSAFVTLEKCPHLPGSRLLGLLEYALQSLTFDLHARVFLHRFHLCVRGHDGRIIKKRHEGDFS
jgi:hypothetical protein